jgi:hypothetical protein
MLVSHMVSKIVSTMSPAYCLTFLPHLQIFGSVHGFPLYLDVRSKENALKYGMIPFCDMAVNLRNIFMTNLV